MKSDPGYLALWLDGPLQSWGYQSRFDQRTTLAHPTRSGLVGMLSAAMGIDRRDSQGLQIFSRMAITIYAFRQGPLLEDFHTIGGGWNHKQNPQNIVVKTDGNPTAKEKPGVTVVSRRQYLQASRFGVVVECPADLGGKLAAALVNPRWGIWLGRKSCIPAAPVFQGSFPTHAQALERLQTLAGHKPQRVVKEVDKLEEGTETLMDFPLDFSKRLFRPRRIAVE